MQLLQVGYIAVIPQDALKSIARQEGPEAVMMQDGPGAFVL